MRSDEPQRQQKVTVWYDGACPLCRQEIDLLRRRDSESVLHLVDLAAAPAGTPRPHDQMMARFHARDRAGVLVSGAEAFLVAWAATPRLGWLETLRRVRPLVWGLDLLYGQFLRLRPQLQKWAGHLHRS